MATYCQDNYLTIDGTVLPDQLGDGLGSAIFSSGAGAPTSTPTSVPLFYVDTTAKKLYVAMGTASSADWVAVN
jgi:hypothetical protein